MTRLERLEEEKSNLEERMRKLLLSGDIVTLLNVKKRIADLDESIEDARRYEPQQMSKMLTKDIMRKYKINEIFIKTHLAADFLADCALEVKEVLSKLDIQYCSIYEMLDEIFKHSQHFANFVCRVENQKLIDFMCNNEDYIKALHGFTSNYINSRIDVDKV
jgi:hypothetical protein